MLHTKKPNEKQIELIFTNVKNILTKKTNKKYKQSKQKMHDNQLPK